MTNERVSDTTREFETVAAGLLRLHKTLLDLERRDYERARGRIGNSYEFLQLVLKDPWFDWLHRLSGAHRADRRDARPACGNSRD